MAVPFLSSCLVLSTVWLSSLVTAQHLPHEKGCVHLPIVHSTNARLFGKRGVQLQLANRSDVAYYAQLSIGTPPQPVFVQLDTGSFELWVNPDCTTVEGADAVFCERVGQYDASKSSTAVSLGTSRTLRYGIGTANITYVTDTITLAGTGTTLQGVQFGVATATEDAFSGILGIGYGKGIATRYLNFVDQLKEQNATKVKAFSLSLGSKDAQEGVVVFGGVDTSKFAGHLTQVPIIPASQSPDGVPRFWVSMRSLAMTPPSGISKHYSGSEMPVFLDSGSTMTLLPPNLTEAIARDFGSKSEDAYGFHQIDCSLTKLNGTLDFYFDGVMIKVPYKELTREVPTNPPACFLGIMASDQFTLLGDTFLRSAYALFDLETDSIWMTQAANCGSTPAALNSVEDIQRITGLCDLSVPADNTTSSTEAFTPMTEVDQVSMTTVTSVTPIHTSTTATSPTEEVSIQSSATSISGANKLGRGNMEGILFWGPGVVIALHVLIGV